PTATRRRSSDHPGEKAEPGEHADAAGERAVEAAHVGGELGAEVLGADEEPAGDAAERRGDETDEQRDDPGHHALAPRISRSMASSASATTRARPCSPAPAKMARASW